MILCRFCKSETTLINDFGPMPIANGFYPPSSLNKYRFNLSTSFCNSCKLFQIVNQPEKELMFNENYPFFTGLSKKMTEHFHKMVTDSFKTFSEINPPKFVVEIGCNDGTLLQKVNEMRVKHVGIDPSSNVVERARGKGINVEAEFFGLEVAGKIKEKYSSADIIFAANVICHLPDISDVILGIKALLSEEGVFIFEEPYAGSVLELTSFDQFYDEHVYIFSLISIQNIFESVGLELFDAIPQETHGGSMRYFIARKGTREKTSGLQNLIQVELNSGLSNISKYQKFAENCISIKNELVALLIKLRNEGKTVGGYAATSKSTTVLNYCELDSSLISFICDSTPEKIGMLTPGSRIPIITIEEMHLNPPDYLVLFGWNHEKEIREKEVTISNAGVKWIKYIPRVEVIDH